MYKNQFFAGFILLFVVLLTIGGCKKDDDGVGPGPSPTIILAPTNLKAFSASSVSVGLQWTLSVSETAGTFNNYLIRVKDSVGALIATQTVPKGTPEAMVGSLTGGVIYTFVVRSTITGGGVSADSVTIRWSPARRYTTDSASVRAIRVYEMRGSGFSGLQFGSAGGFARVISLSSANPDRILCDIYVDSVSGGAIGLRNISILAFPRNTFFSTVTRDAADLNDPQSVPPDPGSYSLNRVDLPTGTVSQSRVVFARSITDNKYVRILVKRNPATSLLYYGTGSDRYVTLELSYQNTAGNPYARPGHTTRTTGQ